MDERALNELLECSVCLERLDASSKVLPCQHTFCKRCLEEIISTKNELRCPECRTLVEVRVEDLPTNILLIRLLEGMKNAKAGIGCLSLTPTTLAVTLAGFTSGTSSSGSRSPSSPIASGGVHTSPGPKSINTALPCAKALYNYDGKESGDLSFKKGDMILLRKQVDDNWFHGELNGHHGFFPATYVQVITELPQEVPKCKALYDFALSDKNEKDCLTFQKDEVLTVIRRVDDNWAEGKLGERIGIFPISFVDMNDSAKWLINTQASHASHGSQPSGRPPTSTPSSSNSSSTSPTSSQNGPSTSNASAVDPEPSTSTGSHSEPSSPVVKTPPRTAAVTAPQPTPRLSLMTQSAIVTSSQTSALNPALVAVKQSSQKRHSLSTIGVHKALVPHTQHRHSVELSGSTLGTTVTTTAAAMVASSAPVQVMSAASVPKAASQQTPQVPGAEGGDNTSSGASAAPSIPAFYIALYNYKPQKEDEIELRKGEYYTVSEKCQDGWFKGTCLRSGDVGVFPGNYVQLVKISSKQVSKMAQGVCSGNGTSGQSLAVKQQHVTVSRAHSFPKTSPLAASLDYQVKAGSQGVTRAPNTTAPHSRPITNVTQAQSRSSVSLAQAQGRTTTQTVTTGSHNGQHRSPLASNSQTSQQRSPSSSHSQRSSSVPVLDKHLRSGSGSHHSPRSGRKSKHGHSHSHSHDKNGGAPHGVVPPMRSTSHSQSGHSYSHNHSSSSPSHSMAVSGSANVGVTPPNIVVGVGAGSPTLGAMASAPNKERLRDSHRDKDRDQVKEKKERKEKERLQLDKLGMGLVKRFTKSKKSRSPPPPPPPPPPEQPEGATADPPSLHHRSGSLPNDSGEGATAAALPHHKKTGSLDSAQIKPPRTKPLLRERYRCIVPYPPQSDIELELKVGDIVYVHKKRDDGWYKGTLQRTG